MMNRWQIARMVSDLKPGKSITISSLLLADCAPIPGFSVAESIMENIVGSAYEFVFREDRRERVIVFSRLPTPLTGNLRTYVSPDRKWLFKQRSDGLYEPDLPSFNRDPAP